MKKVLFLTYHFPTPNKPGSFRPWVEANILKKLGFDVTIITSGVDHITGELKIKRKTWAEENIYGFKVIKVFTLTKHRTSILKRGLHYLLFSFFAFWTGIREKNVDIIFLGSHPFTMLSIGYILKILKKDVKIIIDERDVYPDTAIALGVLKNSFLIKILDKCGKFFRKNADFIIAATPGIKRILIEKGICSEKIITIPNVDIDLIRKFEMKNNFNVPDLRIRFNKSFIVIYTGGLGLANDILTILKAARIVQGKNDKIGFVIVGGGDRLKFYKKFLKDKDINNVFFIPPVGREISRYLISQAGICIHALKKHKYWECALASKIFDYFLMKKPVIFAGWGDIEKLLKESNGGISVPPEDYKQLAEKILLLSIDKEKLQKMGINGYNYIVNHYSPESIINSFKRVFCGV